MLLKRPVDLALETLKIPPHSIEAEQSVLGGLLLDNLAWERIGDKLCEEDFYRFDHRLIYKQLTKMINNQKPVDVITLFESLRQSGRDGDTGGISYLNSLAHNTPSAANISRYADIVRERAVLRKLITVADQITTSAFNPAGQEVREILDKAESQIFAIAEDGTRTQQGFQEIKPVLTKVLNHLDELQHRSNVTDIVGIPTGFIDLDNMTSGLHPGDLTIIAGRPSMGKTALALNIGEYIAISQALPVAVFSMEMGASQLATRMLGSIGRIDQHVLRTGRLIKEHWTQITQASKKINEAPLFIDETPALTPIELRARARRLTRTCSKLGLIIIDYLQLMSVSRSGENRATEISEISRSLKALAKELNCPVIALSQLNRGLEQRINKRPVMSDLRESGAIEQDADVILFIYRDEVYDKGSKDKGIAELLISKQRNGPIGDVRLKFTGKYTKFENLTEIVETSSYSHERQIQNGDWKRGEEW